MSISFGLDIAANAYRAFTQANAVIGNNIANANTPGYSQEVPELREGIPLNNLNGVGTVGTGARMVGVERLRDEFLDQQLRSQNFSLGYDEVLNSTYSNLKVIFPDYAGITATGLQSQINQFFADFSTLSTAVGTASENTARSTLVNDAMTMTATFRQTEQQLNNQVGTLNQQISSTVGQINTYLQQIAGLNKEIVEQTSAGLTPNTLMDQRDLAITNLSQLMNFNQVNMADNSVYLNVKGVSLVQEGQAYQLSPNYVVNNNTALPFAPAAPPWPAPGPTFPMNPSFYGVSSGQTDLTNAITGGELGGYLSSRDDVIVPLEAQLNELASSMISQINTLHHAGYVTGAAAPPQTGVNTGFNFFTGTNALNINVDPNIQNNPSNIAAARVCGDGDGDNAAYMSEVQNFLLNANAQSILPVNQGAGGSYDPSTAMSSPFITGAHTLADTFNVNGVPIAWNQWESMDTFIGDINAALGGQAVASFDYSTQKITFIGTQQVTLSDAGGSLIPALRTQNQIFSASAVNIQQGPADYRVDPNRALNDITAGSPVNIHGYNRINFFSPTSSSGSFTVNGNTVNYLQTDTLSNIIAALPGGYTGTFNAATQQFGIRSMSPINIQETSGNFTQLMNLAPPYSFTGFYNNLMSQVSSGADEYSNNYTNDQSAATQIQNQINAVSQVNTDEQLTQETQLAKSYEAMAQFAAVVNEMLNVLINGTGVTSSNTTSTQNSSSSSAT